MEEQGGGEIGQFHVFDWEVPRENILSRGGAKPENPTHGGAGEPRPSQTENP